MKLSAPSTVAMLLAVVKMLALLARLGTPEAEPEMPPKREVKLSCCLLCSQQVLPEAWQLVRERRVPSRAWQSPSAHLPEACPCSASQGVPSSPPLKAQQASCLRGTGSLLASVTASCSNERRFLHPISRERKIKSTCSSWCAACNLTQCFFRVT